MQGWRFDTVAGFEEIYARRIGRNELHAIAVLEAYVLAQPGIPLVLANARLSARSTAGYRRVPRLMAKTLAAVTAIAAQTKPNLRLMVSSILSGRAGGVMKR